MNSSIWVIWQLWARSADTRSYSAITQSFEEILPQRQTLTPRRLKTTLIEILPQLSQDEIPRDSTRFHETPSQSSKDDPDDKDDPATRTILTTYSISIPICLSVKWLHRGRVRLPRSSSISQKTGSNRSGNYKPSWTNEFGPTLTQLRKHLNKVYFKNHPIQTSQILMRMQPYMHSSWRISRKRTIIADDTTTRT